MKTQRPWSMVKIYLKNLIKLKVFNNKNVDPFICGFYVTRKCNFKCNYCEIKDNADKGLDTEETKKLLKILRKSIPSISFTGGEPLLRPDIVEILKEAKRLKFYPVALFSNLSLLNKKEEVLDYIDVLSTSLGGVDPSYDKITGVKGSTELIKKNIKKYSKLQNDKNFALTINCVIGEHNVDSASEVIDFAVKNKCAISVGPVVNRGAPPANLKNNKKYQALVDRLIEMKKKQKLVSNTFSFLRIMRNFKPYACHPFLVPRVFSNGDIAYPCEILNHKRANILKHKSFKKAYAELRKNYKFDCKLSCYLGCYAEPSLFLEHPLESVNDYLYFRKLREFQ